MSDELTAAEKFEIRRWAWGELGHFQRIKSGEESPLTLPQRMHFADELAAWAMSGAQPSGPK